MKIKQYKKINKDNTLPEKLLSGVNLIADTVKVTLGAKGQLVGIAKPFGVQHLTKDGVSVAKEVSSIDTVEDFAINVVREASQRTAYEAGDGTTSVLVLTQALYRLGLDELKNGANATDLNNLMQDFSRKATEYIKENAIHIEQSDINKLTDIATVSANGDKDIGRKIAEITSKIGPKGVVTIEPSNTLGVNIDFVEGMEVESGFISPYFINQQKPECILEEPMVLVTTKKISSFPEISSLIAPILQRDGAMSLVIIAEEVDGEALKNLVLNHTSPQVPLKCCVVQLPATQGNRDGYLRDICTVTGATLIDDTVYTEFKEEYLGKIKKFKANKDKSLLVAKESDTEMIQEYISKLKLELEDLKADYDRSRLEQRIARLSSGVAVIKIGASTEVESQEIRDRLDDAIRATQSALEEGYMAGGGAGYLELTQLIASSSSAGRKYVSEILNGRKSIDNLNFIYFALQEPFKQILRNGDFAENEIGEGIAKAMQIKGKGINIATGEVVDLIKAGIIDPAKVIRQAVQNSISVVSQLLLTKAVITNEIL